MTEISLSGRGARGESQADILRRTGQFGVLPTDTDAEAMGKLNADAAGFALVAGVSATSAMAARDVAIAAGVQYPTEAAAVAALADGAFGSYLDGDGNPVWGQRDGAVMVALPGPWLGFDKIGGLSPSAGWALPVSMTSTLAVAFATLYDSIAANGSTDDTTALIAWEDAVTAYASGGATIQTPDLNFGPRRYAVGSISKKSYAWRGAGTDNTRLIFNGTSGVDWITQDTVTGRNSAGQLTDMTLDGQNCGTIYKIPQNGAGFGTDDRLLIERVRFVDGTNHVHWDAWVNARGENNRHDNWSGYALILEPKASQNQSHFEYNCTFDTNSNGQTTNSPLGFALLDFTALSTSGNCGVIKFSGKRWEVNQATLGGNKAFIQIETTSGAARQAEIILDGVTIQNSFGGGVTSLFHRSAGGGTGAERYAFYNVQMNGIGSFIFAGDYPTWMKAIPTGNWFWLIGDPINGFVGLRTVSSGATGLEFYSPASNTVIRSVSVPGEASPRIQERPDVLLAGSGSVAPTVLLRHVGRTGWTLPSGTLARSDPNYTAATISATYSQAEVQALANQIQTLSRIVSGLINDLHVSGSGSHGLLRP